MSDLETIFINGGEYVNKSAYFKKRADLKESRQAVSALKTEIERLKAELAASRDEAKDLRAACEQKQEIIDASAGCGARVQPGGLWLSRRSAGA